jgi:superfamily II DNA or RNA helicase
MTAPTLRPYQAEVIERIDAAIAAGYRRLLVVAPTGAGKTVIAAAITSAAVEDGRRVLFLAHRRELITQASGKLYAAARLSTAPRRARASWLCVDRARSSDPDIDDRVARG